MKQENQSQQNKNSFIIHNVFTITTPGIGRIQNIAKHQFKYFIVNRLQPQEPPFIMYLN